MFVIIDGNIKLFGVFDGHGPRGHLTSSFAQAKFVQYIQENKKFFESKNLRTCDDQEIEI